MATLREAIDKAKLNPNSPFATELRRRIEAGNFDSQAKREGIELPGVASRSVRADFKGDIRETVQNIKNSFGEAADTTAEEFRQIREGEQGTLRGIFRGLGAAASGTSKVISNAVIGAGKAVLPQGAEDAIATTAGNVATKVSETDLAQKTIQGMQKLEQENPELARDIKAGLGFLELGTDLAGGLVGKKAAKGITNTAIKAGDKATEKVLKAASRIGTRLDDAVINQTEKALQLNPSDIRRIKKPNIAGQSPAEWVAERGFKGSQKQILEDLTRHSGQSIDEVNEALASVETILTGKDVVPARKILDVLEKTFNGTVGNDEILDSISALKNSNGLTLTQMNDIKRMVDRELDLYRATGDLKSSAQAKGLANLRNELKTTIEERAADVGIENIRALNKETQVSKEIADALAKKLDVKGSNLEIGLRDAILGLGGAVGISPLSGVGIVVTKKMVESSAFRTSLAQSIKKLRQSEKQALINAFKARSADGSFNATVKRVIQEAAENAGFGAGFVADEANQ